jgi:hypothetical protein
VSTGDCERVFFEQLDPPAIRARSTSYVCDVEFGLRNLSAWVQAHQEDSRNPNRMIFLFAELLSSLLTRRFSFLMVLGLDFWRSSAVFVIMFLAGEPACYLGGYTDKGRCRVVDGALFLGLFSYPVAQTGIFCICGFSHPVAQTGVFCLCLVIALPALLRGGAGGRIRPSR